MSTIGRNCQYENSHQTCVCNILVSQEVVGGVCEKELFTSQNP